MKAKFENLKTLWPYLPYISDISAVLTWALGCFSGITDVQKTTQQQHLTAGCNRFNRFSGGYSICHLFCLWPSKKNRSTNYNFIVYQGIQSNDKILSAGVKAEGHIRAPMNVSPPVQNDSSDLNLSSTPAFKVTVMCMTKNSHSSSICEKSHKLWECVELNGVENRKVNNKMLLSLVSLLFGYSLVTHMLSLAPRASHTKSPDLIRQTADVALALWKLGWLWMNKACFVLAEEMTSIWLNPILQASRWPSSSLTCCVYREMETDPDPQGVGRGGEGSVQHEGNSDLCD